VVHTRRRSPTIAITRADVDLHRRFAGISGADHPPCPAVLVIVFLMIAVTIVGKAALGGCWVSIGCAFGGNSAFIPKICMWTCRRWRHGVGRGYLVT
jgi:hypothetical protein